MTTEQQTENVAAKSTYDFVGMWLSIACAVHCVATPVLIALLPVLAHAIPGSEHVHRVLAVGVVSAGALAFRSGLKRHRRKVILIPAAIGMSIIVGTAIFGGSLSHFTETIITMCGSAFIIWAHWLNHTFCQSCTVCHHH